MPASPPNVTVPRAVSRLALPGTAASAYRRRACRRERAAPDVPRATTRAVARRAGPRGARGDEDANRVEVGGDEVERRVVDGQALRADTAAPPGRHDGWRG